MMRDSSDLIFFMFIFLMILGLISVPVILFLNTTNYNDICQENGFWRFKEMRGNFVGCLSEDDPEIHWVRK